MNYKKVCSLFILLVVVAFGIYYGHQYFHKRWTASAIENVIQQKNRIVDEGSKIEFISEKFLKTPYKSSTLIGNAETAEILVVNLEEVDCFTFLDYVEAFRWSSEPNTLPDTLRQIRYKEGKISYQARHHFFTDWIASNQDKVDNVTQEIAGENVISSAKKLNLKKDEGYFLPGIPVTERTISYIPANTIPDVASKLKNGDYVGFYTDIEGLDVTHVGIIIKTDNQIFLRHASSRPNTKKVIDEDFLTYSAKQPGIVVARPQSSSLSQD